MMQCASSKATKARCLLKYSSVNTEHQGGVKAVSGDINTEEIICTYYVLNFSNYSKNY